MTAATIPGAQLAAYTLRLGDDALILAQRLSEWAARGPELEEDIALTNIALDLLGQARALLTRAGQLEAPPRSEDALAYLRSEREYLNVLLVEQPNGDFAQTIVRQLLFSSYQLPLYARLQRSKDELLAGVAGKAVKEVAYHRDHAFQWTLRLGDGTEESHARMQAALDRLWPYTDELFADDELTARLEQTGVGVNPSSLRAEWDEFVRAVLERATLARPETAWKPAGGRLGRHSEDFGYLLAEMQSLHRAHPGVQW